MSVRRPLLTEGPSGNVTELIAREAVGDVLVYLQNSEQNPHLRVLLLKRHVMQTEWTELFCPLREVTLLLPSFLSSLTPADPVTFILSVCGFVIDGTSELLSFPKQLASRRAAPAQTASSLLLLLLLLLLYSLL